MVRSVGFGTTRVVLVHRRLAALKDVSEHVSERLIRLLCGPHRRGGGACRLGRLFDEGSRAFVRA